MKSISLKSKHMWSAPRDAKCVQTIDPQIDFAVVDGNLEERREEPVEIGGS